MKVSVIVPVYNSSMMLKELCKRIFNTMNKLNLKNDFELIMINDSSYDDSWDKICELTKNYNFILGINLKENFGQHNVMLTKSGLNTHLEKVKIAILQYLLMKIWG